MTILKRYFPHFFKIRLLLAHLDLYSKFGLEITNWQFDIIRILLGYKIIHCLGDSHTHLFQDIQRRKLMQKTIIRSVKVGGATAMGIANINSTTNSLKIFQRYIRFIKKQNTILFMLGEVDCGYLIWYRANKYNTPIEIQLQRALNNYQDFILHLLDAGHLNIILSSAPLPAILDEEDWEDKSYPETQFTPTFKQRKDTHPKMSERTNLTRQFNEALRQFCDENNILFLDFEQDILNSDTGLIDNIYRQSNPTDNHLRTDTVLPYVKKRLQNLGFN